MIRFSILVGLFLTLFACKSTIKTTPVPAAAPSMTYPTTRRDATVKTDYHGTTVMDPYRWLEDDNSAETKAWVIAENAVTNAYLKKLSARKAIQERLTSIWNFERFGTPFKEGGNYYFFKNDGLQNQSVLYAQTALDGPATMLLDPNTLSKTGTVALGALQFDKSGKYMAYQVSEAGSDWNKINVMNALTGEFLEDKTEWVKFSGISWLGEGYFYSRYPQPKEGDALKGKSLNHAVYYHKLGTKQADDKLIISDDAHPEYNFGASVTDDERFVIVSVSESTSGNQLYIKDLRQRGTKFLESNAETANYKEFVPISTDFEHDFDVIDNIEDQLLVMTNYKAPKQQIYLIDPQKPTADNWKVLVPESKDVLTGASILGGKLVLTYLHNAYSMVRVVDPKTGKLIQELALPGIGSVGIFSGKSNDNTAFYSFTSYTYPSTIFKLDMGTLKSEVFKAPNVKGFDPTAYETKQVWYKSKDGTSVPMFITHKKGLALNGKNPTWLYGYGGFNISLTPSFSVAKLAFMEQGGVFVVANLRGGGEFGSDWHEAGTKERKQNVFDDFIGAAENLIQLGYTSKPYLGIEGGSNGGLLVGACMTQRPDLFQVCFPRVGVLDMLRYDQFTIGRAWSIDYGLSEDADAFKYLYKYSPLHNVKPTSYPATMVMTADHDDRVVPAHSFKFAAELQYQQKGPAPTLIRIETSAGHGAGKPTSKVIEENADMIAFLLHNMGLTYKPMQ